MRILTVISFPNQENNVRDPKVTERTDPPITPYGLYACLLRCGQRSRAGDSSRGRRESDTPERLNGRTNTHTPPPRLWHELTHTYTHTHTPPPWLWHQLTHTHTHTPLHHGCGISLHTHTHTPLHHGCGISLYTVGDRHDLRS